MKNTFPDPETLPALLDYDPDSGKLFWKSRPIEMFKSKRGFSTWNSRFAGNEAFTASTNGYRVGPVNYKLCMAHRVVWAMTYGYWPEYDVDHINGDRADNRLVNLREASRSENNCNSGVRSDNSSGYRGVSWHSQYGKWEARIYADCVKHHLGYFSTKEDAHSAYVKASKELHGEFSRAA